jgi:hypothetical protein
MVLHNKRILALEIGQPIIIDQKLYNRKNLEEIPLNFEKDGILLACKIGCLFILVPIEFLCL